MKRLIYTTAVNFPNKFGSNFLVSAKLINKSKYSAKYALLMGIIDNELTAGKVSIKYDRNLKKFIITDFINENWQFRRMGSSESEPTNIKYFKETFIEEFKNSTFDHLSQIFYTIDSPSSLNFDEMIAYTKEKTK